MGYDDFVKIARRRDTHKDMSVLFEVEGLRFEVVGGFLKEGENEVPGKNALAQVPGAIGEEDFGLLCTKLIYSERNPFPSGYNIMTAARTEDGKAKGFYFGRSKPNFRWNGREFVDEPPHWMVIDWSTEAPWDEKFLIIRRVE